ncbi:phosphatidate phosphatase [Acrasis kona]|uniref:Phosphatidate phosphatase n=1 Tax=Acrasis kona TaxID=1008807 RepID=A0AAW2YH90_9EUKA
MSCVDIVAIRQPDGTFKCSPIIVRFSKIATVKQYVSILIDGDGVNNNCGFQFVLDKGYQYGHFEPIEDFQQNKLPDKSQEIDANEQSNVESPLKNPHYYKKDTKDRVEAIVKDLPQPIDTKNDHATPSVTSSLVKKMYNIFGGENEAAAEVKASDSNKHSEEHVTAAALTWSESILSHINSEHYTNEMMTPCTEWINQLNLNKRGEVCKVTFVSNGEMVNGKLFVWDHNVKIVISDVDGTITKSDIWGFLYTQMGKDYTHEGISKLYTSIHKLGYKFIYLTARPITQATATRVYIESIHQNKHVMPSGPVITTPNRLMMAMAREVIIRRPETFKIAMLLAIKNIFLENEKPFIAGFGNRPTDCQSYIAAGVDPSRSYRINPKGELTVFATSTVFNGYNKLHEIVNDLFPSLLKAVHDHLQLTQEDGGDVNVVDQKPKHVNVDIMKESRECLRCLPVEKTRVDVIDELNK